LGIISRTEISLVLNIKLQLLVKNYNYVTKLSEMGQWHKILFSYMKYFKVFLLMKYFKKIPSYWTISYEIFQCNITSWDADIGWGEKISGVRKLAHCIGFNISVGLCFADVLYAYMYV